MEIASDKDLSARITFVGSNCLVEPQGFGTLPPEPAGVDPGLDPAGFVIPVGGALNFGARPVSRLPPSVLQAMIAMIITTTAMIDAATGVVSFICR